MLYRMSYSSIIRESEDLGAGHLRPRRQRAGRVGLDADVHGRDAEDRQGRDLAPRRRHPRGRRHPAQRPVPRRHPLPRRRDRDPDLPRGRARRLRRRLGAPARHRRRVSRASRSTSSTTGPRATSTGRSSSTRRASGRTGLWEHILENTRTPTYNSGDIQAMIAACELAKSPLRRAARALRRGAGPRRRAAPGSTTPSGCCARRSRRCPDGALRDRGRLARRRRPQPRREAAGQGRGHRSRATRSRIDLTGSSDEVPTGYNCPFEGTTVSAMTFITRMIFLDEVAYPGVRARRTRACSSRSR